MTMLKLKGTVENMAKTCEVRRFGHVMNRKTVVQ